MVAVVVVVVGGVGVLQAAPVARTNPALEARFRAEVAAASVDAAKAYDEGNAARDAGKIDGAVVGYRRAVELAPNVDHPHRRLCWALAAQGSLEQGIPECETALRLAPTSAWDKSAMAAALLARQQGNDQQRAFELAREASDAEPDDVTTAERCGMAAAMVNNPLTLRRCTERMLRLDPDGQLANLLGASIAGDRDFEEAHVRLRKAKTAGLSQSTFDQVTKEFEDMERKEEVFPISAHTALWVGIPTLAIWLGVMLLLLIAGTVLSRKTLATVEHAATTRTVDASGTERERRLRRLYRRVLLLSGLYFDHRFPSCSRFC